MVKVTILEATMVEFNMIEVTMVEITMRLSIGASAWINLPVYERLFRKCNCERSQVKTQLPPVIFLSFQKELERRHQEGLHLLPSWSTMVYEQ